MNKMLEVIDLKKTYDKKTIFNNWSYTFEKGKVYGLVGKNGVGKTTLLKVISGLIIKDKGEIFKDNKDSRIAYLSDEIDIPRFLTGEEFLIFLSTSWETQVDYIDLTKKFGIYDNLSKGIYSYSKGMLQKLRLVGALISNPDILLLDEPLTGVDNISSKEILKQLENFIKLDKTIIYASHINDAFNYFKNITIIELK